MAQDVTHHARQHMIQQGLERRLVPMKRAVMRVADEKLRKELLKRLEAFEKKVAEI